MMEKWVCGLELGEERESLRVLIQAQGSVIDLTFTCRVQRALVCRLGWKSKVQVDITMQV